MDAIFVRGKNWLLDVQLQNQLMGLSLTALLG
jgi:hypothetical protein